MDRDTDFAEYVRARWTTLVRAAVLLGCGLDEAEDLAQTTLLRCYVSWTKVSRATNPDAYVYRTLVNARADSRRRWWWGERPYDAPPEQAVPDLSTRVDDADAVRRALARLSHPSRTVVVLRYYAMLSEEQIAQTLGIARGTVKSRLSRGLRQLGEDRSLAELFPGGADHDR